MVYTSLDNAEVLDKLNRLGKKLDDTTLVMQEIGEEIKASILKNFEVGGRYSEVGSVWGGNKRWKPIKYGAYLNRRFKGNLLVKSGKRTKKAVMRARQDKKVLVDRGRLRNSIHAKAGRREVILSTNVAYAPAHNFGGKGSYPIKPRNAKALYWFGAEHPVKAVLHPPQEARPFMVVQREDMTNVSRMLDKYLTS